MENINIYGYSSSNLFWKPIDQCLLFVKNVLFILCMFLYYVILCTIILLFYITMSIPYFFTFSDKERNVLHFTSSDEFKVSWQEIVELGRRVIEERLPLNGVAWYLFNLIEKISNYIKNIKNRHQSKYF